MKNVLVVFSGKAQSGKTTASKILRDIANSQLPRNYDFDIGPRANIYSFATALKTIATEYFGWTGDKEIYYEDVTVNSGSIDIQGDGSQIDSTTKVPVPDKGRQLLINIGQHMRAIRETVWVDYVINKIKDSGKHGDNKLYILDDMRFKNELALAKTFESCVSVRLTRSSQLDINDISENDLDNSEFDYYIENNGDADDLKLKMSGLFEKIKLQYQ